MKTAICEEPWPAKPIDQYQCIEDGAWGFLLIFDDWTTEFDTSRQPDRASISLYWPKFREQRETRAHPNNSEKNVAA